MPKSPDIKRFTTDPNALLELIKPQLEAEGKRLFAHLKMIHGIAVKDGGLEVLAKSRVSAPYIHFWTQEGTMDPALNGKWVGIQIGEGDNYIDYNEFEPFIEALLEWQIEHLPENQKGKFALLTSYNNSTMNPKFIFAQRL